MPCGASAWGRSQFFLEGTFRPGTSRSGSISRSMGSVCDRLSWRLVNPILLTGLLMRPQSDLWSLQVSRGLIAQRQITANPPDYRRLSLPSEPLAALPRIPHLSLRNRLRTGSGPGFSPFPFEVGVPSPHCPSESPGGKSRATAKSSMRRRSRSSRDANRRDRFASHHP